MTDFGEILGASVFDAAGQQIGKVSGVVAGTTGVGADWLVVGGAAAATVGVFPLQAATYRKGTGIEIPVTYEQLKKAPPAKVVQNRVSAVEEKELFRFYRSNIPSAFTSSDLESKVSGGPLHGPPGGGGDRPPPRPSTGRPDPGRG